MAPNTPFSVQFFLVSALSVIIYTDAFTPSSRGASLNVPRRATLTQQPAPKLTILHEQPASLVVTNQPSPSQIATLVEAPSHTEIKSGTWSEYISAGETSTNYFIVEGEGSITCTPSFGTDIGTPERRRVKPGTFVEAKGESQLLWDADAEMKILYSGNILSEDQVLLLKAIGGLVGLGGMIFLGTMGH